MKEVGTLIYTDTRLKQIQRLSKLNNVVKIEWIDNKDGDLNKWIGQSELGVW